MKLDWAQARVARFMVAGGQSEGRLESFTMPDVETFERRRSLLQEELNELIEAWTEGNAVEFVDAYADLLYVLLGGVEEAGFDIEPMFEAVADANDKKIDWMKGKPFVTREDGKILKPEGWVGPEERIAYLLGGES